jgi:excisionase family DNA binding protein
MTTTMTTTETNAGTPARRRGRPPGTPNKPKDPAAAHPGPIAGGYLRVKQVAAMLRVSPSQVYGLCEARRLPHVRFGRTILVAAAHLDEFLRANTVTPGAGPPAA